jgi:hypothetical protein
MSEKQDERHRTDKRLNVNGDFLSGIDFAGQVDVMIDV